jgi:hypothetical protein
LAQKVQVVLTDDLDGSEADSTVRFAWQGIEYEIDLNDSNADALAAALAPYIQAGRRIGGRSTARRGAAALTRRAEPTLDLGEVRAWARANGFQVSDRGRVSAEVKDAYEAAHA